MGCVYVFLFDILGQICGRPTLPGNLFCEKCITKRSVRDGRQKSAFFRKTVQKLVLVEMENKSIYWSRRLGFIVLYDGNFYLEHTQPNLKNRHMHSRL